CQQYDELPFTF
nr:immunoglobulin light chain junction region [Macaca mulatta]MOW12187.1 immunoglobulin light chain junction region [Macaca mulatta]